MKRLQIKKIIETTLSKGTIVELYKEEMRNSLLRLASCLFTLLYNKLLDDETEDDPVLPTEDENLELDAADLGKFVWNVEVEDTECNRYEEARHLGKCSMDVSRSIYLYPSEENCEGEETELKELSTDEIFRFCTLLEQKLNEYSE